jgi:hypothetical protein
MKYLPYLRALTVCLTVSGFANAAFTSGYSLRDTVSYFNETYSGRLTLLYYRGVPVDSIDAGFGLHQTGGDTLLYLRVETIRTGLSTGTYFTTPVLVYGGLKNEINDSLPFYIDQFSSPGVVDSCLYYWGLTMENVYAVKITFPEFKADSIKLDIGGGIITDSPDYFSRPSATSDGIIFALKSGKRFLVSRGMRSVKILPDERDQ